LEVRERILADIHEKLGLPGASEEVAAENGSPEKTAAEP
jgi:hypothetical protein